MMRSGNKKWHGNTEELPLMSQPSASNSDPHPFLKWAGGKGQLLEELRAQALRATPFGRYHEPFVGGGALFFALYRSKLLGHRKAILSDNNPNLISVYTSIQQDVEKIIKQLRVHQAHHSKEYYYDVRAHVPEALPERAARIIYLNKTCFNGLYRENSKGLFNVPMGDYKNPLICDEDNLRAVSEALQHTRITQQHFSAVLNDAKPGDFVYFDPPYHPISSTASFTAYAKGGFGETDQHELAKVFAKLTQRGVKALLSNSMTPFVCDLYAKFTIDEVLATRSVNSRADRRGKISEALIRNF